ncbi:hypothetical protein D9M68_264620 [compost metagenome]
MTLDTDDRQRRLSEQLRQAIALERDRTTTHSGQIERGTHCFSYAANAWNTEPLTPCRGALA